MYKIQTLNKISAKGLDEFERENYEVASEILNADAILLRSFDMHSLDIPKTLKAVARAGAGTNNIPIEAMSEKGIVVFNTPGANANAVKELVMAALFFSSRPIIQAHEWAKTLLPNGSDIPDLAEKGKSQFVGPEIKGKTLGVIGLGAIGAMVANTASELGMKVIGFDPYISIDNAWALSRAIKKAESLDALLSKADYITLHLPQNKDTKALINEDRISSMKKGVRVLNFSRGGLVVNDDIITALKNGKIACFVSDFTDEDLLQCPNVICLPHLGASTPEAEDNCAVMAVNQLREFLEKGTIINSVNFPKCKMDNPIPQNGTRLAISNKNIPNMVGQITTVLAEAKQNISSMINHNRDDIAYNLIDIEGIVEEDTLDTLRAIEGIINVRSIMENEK